MIDLYTGRTPPPFESIQVTDMFTAGIENPVKCHCSSGPPPYDAILMITSSIVVHDLEGFVREDSHPDKVFLGLKGGFKVTHSAPWYI